LDTSWKHHAKWKKLDTKGQIHKRVGEFIETESRLEIIRD
jgi:hypothetical protein